MIMAIVNYVDLIFVELEMNQAIIEFLEEIG